MQRASGYTLVDLVVSFALLAIAAFILVPPLLSASAALRVDLAATELAAALHQARSLAVRYSTNVAIRFYPEPENGRVGYAYFRDDDGDGVRNADIAGGVDEQLTALRYLPHFGGRVGFGFPPGPPPRDPGDPRRRLRDLDDPIRFNRSELASFNSLGGGTSGSLYVSDGRRHLRVVRLYGSTGKIRVLRWDGAADRWR